MIRSHSRSTYRFDKLFPVYKIWKKRTTTGWQCAKRMQKKKQRQYDRSLETDD